MSKIQDLKKLRSVNSKNSSSTLNQPLPPQETEQPVNQIVNQDVSSNLNQNDISNITGDNVNQVLPQISTQVPIMPTSNPSQSNLMNNSISIKQSIENDEQYIKKKDHIEIDALDEKQKKTLLMTEVPLAFDSKDLFTFHDLIVPGGKNAKLCLVNEPFNKNLRVTEIADHFSFYEPTPVIVLIGANTKRKVKLFAGLSRAALNCRAIIIDSGLQTGVERFCLRKNIELIGIAPESQIEYPKINPEPFSNTLLTNGHTHFILLGKDDKSLKWGQEAKFKVNFAERLASGRKGAYPYKSKVVGVILGNVPGCIDEMMMFVERKWPMILIEDSDIAATLKEIRNGNEEDGKDYGEKLNIIGKYQKLIEIDDDSENLAASIHICLTLSF